MPAPHAEASLQQSFLAALQTSLLDWPGRLPSSLTKLVVELGDGVMDKQQDCQTFMREHLPVLTSLRHLAFYEATCLDGNLPILFDTAGALPQLRSLHMVRTSRLLAKQPSHLALGVALTAAYMI